MKTVLAVAGASLTLAACSISGKTVHHAGVIGQTLTGPGGLQITPTKYRPRVPAPRHDVTGLATPAPGAHFASFLISMCINTTDLPTISQQNFSLELASGDDAVLKFPQDVFSNDLDLLGEAGCEQGHIVFQVPTGGQPANLRFKLDYSRPDPNGGSTFDTHVRLVWAV
jgi:hypothetical protein